MPTAAQRQFLVKVSQIDGYWTTKGGGATTSEVAREFDGGSLTPELLAAPAQTGDITVSRAYKPERDAQLLALYRPRVGRERATITVQPTDADLVRIGPPTIYANALLAGVNDPEADANSGQPARIELTFAVADVK
jgi:hypothetical protein